MGRRRICWQAILRGAVLMVAAVGAVHAPAQGQNAPPVARDDPQRPPITRDNIRALGTRVEAILADAKAERGHWGVLVVDATTGQAVYALNEGRYFTPASNTKLYTTALALATLGPEHRFRTTIETRGRIDAHGRLIGDLILVGRGDPNLSNRVLPYDKDKERDGPPEKILALLADSVASRGLKQIEGDIIGDDSYYPLERYPGGWAISDMTSGFGAPVSALTASDNALFIEVRPGEREGEPAWFQAEPLAEFYEFRNELRTGPAGSQARVRVERDPGSRQVTLRGNVPLGRRPQPVTLAVEEPAEYWAAVFKRLLIERGVRVHGQARARHRERGQPPPAEEDGSDVLAEFVSAPLIEDVRVVNKISQNLHAELLLRAVSHAKTEEGVTASGIRFAEEFWKEMGMPQGDVALYDGSGLSRRSLITPRGTVHLLQWAAVQPWAAAYESTLPVAGVDGTLSERMRGTPAEGRVRAKTGSLANTNALSGYAETVAGARVVFSIFGNSHNLLGRDATAIIDAICVAMVEELGRRR